MQSKDQIKRDCFKDWSMCKNAKTWDNYKLTRKVAKKALSEARTQAFEGLYQSLGTKEREKFIYKIAKGRKRNTRNLDQVKFINDKEGKILVQKRDIKEKWKKYFHNLFNEGYEILRDSNRLDIREEDQNYNYYCHIQEHELK